MTAKTAKVTRVEYPVERAGEPVAWAESNLENFALTGRPDLREVWTLHTSYKGERRRDTIIPVGSVTVDDVVRVVQTSGDAIMDAEDRALSAYADALRTITRARQVQEPLPGMEPTP